MPDLLIELFSEEIPARMQGRAGADLKQLVTNGLVEAGLTYAGAAAFTTPRRLTLTVQGLTPHSPTTREERKGPRADAPQKAIDGFLRATGLSLDDLELRDEKKGQIYFASIEKPGRPAAEIVAEVLGAAIRNFPWPKSMRWGAGDLKWVRPLHSILCILHDEAGAEVVPLEVAHLSAGNTTRGHRFLSPDAFTVTSFEDYTTKLARAHVVLDAGARAETIWHDATNQAFAQGLEVVEDKGLLAEVAGLVEWPVVLMGEIGAEFLGLPPEVLQTSMKEHQKFFSVRNPATGRIEKFITVANVATADHGATILAGNQKVLAARLSDAKFFWENDLRVAKAGMTDWTDALANVTFHNKLGSQKDRIERIAALAREIAPLVGADPDQAEQAARIAKADLSSQMVYEFPELQGVMGKYYALEAGLAPEVAAVAEEHYSPLGPSDGMPTAPLSVAVALADKIDTLTGFWAIDEKPTGSKDPFALRRAALGVIRLIFENGVRVNLSTLLRSGVRSNYSVLVTEQRFYAVVGNLAEDDTGAGLTYFNESTESDVNISYYSLRTAAAADEIKTLERQILDERGFAWPIQKIGSVEWELLAFFHDRLKTYLRDRDIPHDVIDACLAMPGNDDLTLLVKRAEALAAFLKTDDGENLVQGFKRANNILTQAEAADGVEYSYGPDVKLAEGPEEKALFAALDRAGGAISPAIEAEDFASAMASMASLRAPIDGFFEAVQVNGDSQILRRNRLNLLYRIRTTCLAVADLTRLDG
ncbi:glycine--tRNA ligase subunit beta [Pseudoruegeria sp. SK021]|uniref:glycine--tRNA ligase subunit beta n=1 Tax=Pseudoruegeria sp. SK021 TaxID=1933035 RepID=UPI000A224CCA|nr:glycine--tRNA ligase subunit beta [Pseudoruegeria sp. SK021]OSP56675.1 glycine--tRNA ligase subunit beta [Pseudoruegeria sp. SK021]